MPWLVNEDAPKRGKRRLLDHLRAAAPPLFGSAAVPPSPGTLAGRRVEICDAAPSLGRLPSRGDLL